MDLNKRIRNLIDGYVSNKDSYSIEDMKNSLSKYTECSDFLIDEADLTVGLNKVYGYLDIDELSEGKSCIITNSVNGRVANAVMDNIHIYSFDNDFYCSTASQIVNAEKNRKDKIEFLFGDISQFFASEFNQNFAADFIVTCPSKYNEVYKKLDCEMKYRNITSYEYYTKRSLSFLQSGGVSMSVVPTDICDFICSAVKDYEVQCEVLDKIKFAGGYSFIFLKRI